MRNMVGYMQKLLGQRNQIPISKPKIVISNLTPV